MYKKAMPQGGLILKSSNNYHFKPHPSEYSCNITIIPTIWLKIRVFLVNNMALLSHIIARRVLTARLENAKLVAQVSLVVFIDYKGSLFKL
jgi:hypothetical protein